ncbi:MAG: hypothetical protein KatS3mg096_182 [Candidatus Parcubacteria bacterium]|nr:MAG: hypothetical protein KatS3mg093_410 [Candidatus Parcubacteria bacterium]GIW67121.1 MAG: hypothetical protein KatS3mg095_1019 [Candidatus Parcubacteria bacterium]GIW67314.1 MAG: hypothetical protein KatS3mg096_182 [Candidatus Parcubacteria bacterium]
MVTKTSSKKSEKLFRKPFVILTLNYWKKIENILEDFEMLTSSSYRKKIQKARSERKLYSSDEVKELLNL